MVHAIAKRIIPPIVKLWVKKINGIENMPEDKNFIMAANHASYLDHWIISSILIPHTNKKLHYLAKKEHFDTFFQRIIHKWFGAIPLDRDTGGADALKWALKALKEGKNIGIYPEGTRTLTGKMQRAKTGVARLALGSKAPILPIGLIGTFKIMPKGQHYPKLKRATVNIGKLMYFNEYYGKENDPETLRLVTTKIMKEIAKLSKQEYNFD